MSARVTIEFTVSAWSRALGVDFKTLSARLFNAGLPNTGKIPAHFVFTAMFGKRDASRIRLLNLQADKLERENKVRAGELVDLPTVETQFWNDWLWPVRTQVEMMPEQLAPLLGGDEAQKILMRWATSTTEIFLKQSPFIKKPSE